jgi:hypothetical protein
MSTLYALLVGINEYANPHIPKLGGCVNDVQWSGYYRIDTMRRPEISRN